MSRSDNKRLGRYYTPEPIAEALARWAIDGDDPRVLDPCYGGGVFLHCALRRLSELGVDDAPRRLFGVDVDPDAAPHLHPLLVAGAIPRQFVTGDFFSTTCQSLGVSGFSAIIGNPPYVRHHDLPRDLEQKASAVLGRDGIRIRRTASYWAYFVLRCMMMLRPGGRMALVLPSSFLHAAYADDVRRLLIEGFSRIHISIIQQRVYADCQEEAIILLAEGRGGTSSGIRVSMVDEMSQLADGPSIHCGRSCDDNGQPLLSAVLPPDAAAAYREVSRYSSVSRLGDIARITLGVVTGGNRFFVVDEPTLAEYPGLRPYARPVVSHSRQLAGIRFGEQDFAQIDQTGQRCHLLVLTPEADREPSVSEYLSTPAAGRASSTFKARARKPWYCLRDVLGPPAFLTYMTGLSPRIVTNETGADSTNTLHRLTSRDNQPVDWDLVALASLSTISAVSSELVGRSYGGGVLKLEPGEAKHLLIPAVELSEPARSRLFASVDKLVRQGRRNEATALVDQLVCERHDTAKSCLAALQRALRILRARRRGHPRAKRDPVANGEQTPRVLSSGSAAPPD